MPTELHFSAAALSLLKSNLGYYGTLANEVELYLMSLLEAAYRALTEECEIQMSPGDIYDDALQAMYAAWLYRKGASGESKPPMVKEAIRNRQVTTALK